MLLATKEQLAKARAELFDLSQSWLHAAIEDARYTPDLAHLMQRKYWPFFIYGEEQPYFPRSKSLVGELPSGWTAYTFMRYSTYLHKAGILSHPLAFETDALGFVSGMPMARNIRGTVVPCPMSRLLKLDRYRQNGLMYKRIWTRVVVKYFENGVRKAYIQRAWMYVANPEHWKDHIDAGLYYPALDQFRHPDEPAFDPHYAFTQDVYETKPSEIKSTVDNEALYRKYISEQQASGKTKVPRVRQGRQRRK